MSREYDDLEPPRRPGPRAEKPAVPDPSEVNPARPGAAAPNAWRPNPKKAAGGRAPAGSKAAAGPGRAAKSLDDAKPYDGKGPGLLERFFFGTVSAGMLATFARQLSQYLAAGVDPLKALTGLERQYARTALGPVIGRLALAMRRGEPMGDAMAREPQAFDAMFLGLMRVAEARGGVPETLRDLADSYEARQRMIRQARSAMIYPIAVLLVASVAIAVITIKVLPLFADLLRDIAGRGAELPLPSRILMGFSGFVQSVGWWLVPVLSIGGLFALARFYKTSAGKSTLDGMLLYVPVFGPLFRKMDTARFARSLSALMGGGLDIGTSIDLTADVMYLAPLRKAVRGTKLAVMNGSELGEALDTTRRFGHDVIAVIESGEETGKLPEALDKLADNYEEQVEYTVKNLGQLIQPMMIVFMGVVVLFIILAVILPYISILTSLGG